MPHIARSRILAALPALFLCAASLHAAQTPYVALVVQATVDVRCKPSTDPKLYPTNRLTQGARILVLEERPDGWLGIQPPAGSFSWINSTQVERIVPTQANWVVKNDSVSVLIGGDVIQARPSVEGVRLARGTQVRVIGQEVRDVDASVWLPIDPPAGEMRYIRAEAVKADPTPLVKTPVTTAASVTDPVKAAGTFTVSRTASKDQPLSMPTQTNNTVPPLPANATPWQQAENYERQGRWNDAIQIYDQLGQKLQTTNPEWADFARKRANYLRSGGKAPVNWSATSSAAEVRATTSTFQPSVQQQPPSQVRLSPPTDPNAQPSQQTASWSSPQPNTQAMARSGTGRLVRSGYYGKGDAQYRLETQDSTFLYATPGPGVDLEQFVDREVELFGTKQYRGDLKAYCMVVSRVQPL